MAARKNHLSRSASSRGGARRSGTGYLERTRRPLNCLIFVLPLLTAYEVGTLFYRDRLLAPRHLAALLKLFGATAGFLPAVMVVAVLLIWHAFSRQKWRADVDALLGMLGESVAGAVPLVGLGLLTDRLLGPMGLAAGNEQNARLAAEILSGIGAGIYEEFLFRLAAIGLVLFVAVEVMDAPKRLVMVAAVIAGSVLFSLYHFLGPDGFSWFQFVFRSAAGAYLSLLYLGRGFGIAVGAHACYNVLVVLT